MARPQHISDDTIVKALAAGGEVTAADFADRLGIGQSTAAKRLAALETAGSVRRTPGGRERGVRVADRWSVAAPEPETAADGGGGQLGKGELGSLVRNYLAARPGETFGPTQVGKALGRSQGAVSNSLAKMAANGEVVLVADNPRRYQIAS